MLEVSEQIGVMNCLLKFHCAASVDVEVAEVYPDGELRIRAL